eukprot:3896526-Rhodomonas_salina.1
MAWSRGGRHVGQRQSQAQCLPPDAAQLLPLPPEAAIHSLLAIGSWARAERDRFVALSSHCSLWSSKVACTGRAAGAESRVKSGHERETINAQFDEGAEKHAGRRGRLAAEGEGAGDGKALTRKEKMPMAWRVRSVRQGCDPPPTQRNNRWMAP